MSARRRGRYIPRTARPRRRGRRRARASRPARRRRRRRASRGTTRAPRRAACRRRAPAVRVTRRPRAARAAPGCVAGQRPRVGASAPVEAQTWLSARSSSDYVSLARLREPSPQSCSYEEQRTARLPARQRRERRRECADPSCRSPATPVRPRLPELADGLPGMFVGADRRREVERSLDLGPCVAPVELSVVRQVAVDLLRRRRIRRARREVREVKLRRPPPVAGSCHSYLRCPQAEFRNPQISSCLPDNAQATPMDTHRGTPFE